MKTILTNSSRRYFFFFIALHAAAYASNAHSVELNCRIEAHITVEVSSAAEGVMSEVLVDENDIVKKGDILARLEATLESATADLRKMQSELESDVDSQDLASEFSARNYKRVSDLYEKKAASFAELDKAKTENKLAQQQLRQAHDRKKQADLEYRRALADLERRTIVSPISGMVVARYKEPGEHIYFEPVLQLVQLDPLRVEVFAPAEFYNKIKEGMTATIKPELVIAKDSYTAEVVRVDRIIDGPSNTFGVLLSIPNPRYELPSGLKCVANFSGIVGL
ncbi:efflux RND transporter periplasmic adaptor subunit [Teredinibacter franksiae]|uniref:efflux RND transporter periplasmic adaptor subunit n=1 Tax=Teredinibacter franksiae TaxID=2761453 RepID=UPI001FE94CDB|nr:efflux RND transporter periplasmic adaptor subunit [Teredinibacter franksiae]